MKSQRQPNDLIPLGPWEELFCSFYDAFESAGMGGIVFRLRGRIEADPLRIALEGLQSRHPKLRVQITRARDGRRYFALSGSPKPIPFEIRDYETEALPWQEECSRIMAEALDPAVDPLAKLLVLRNRASERCDVIFVAHHAIVDGLSALRLVQDLLEYYEETERNGSPGQVSSLPFVMVSRARTTGSILERLTLLARLLRQRRANRRRDWTFLPRENDVAPHRLWSRSVLSEKATLDLVRRCRKEKTTIYGALFAAAACALKVMLPQGRARFKCRFPIDIRGKLTGPAGPVTEHDLGNFISGYEKIYTVDDSPSFWALAREAHQDVQAFSAAGGPALLYNLMRWAKPNLSQGIHKRGTLFVTNYGVVGLRGRYGELIVEEGSTVFRHDRFGPSLMIQTLTIQRRLNLSFSIVDVSEEFWQRLRQEILAQLQRAVDESRA